MKCPLGNFSCDCPKLREELLEGFPCSDDAGNCLPRKIPILREVFLGREKAENKDWWYFFAYYGLHTKDWNPHLNITKRKLDIFLQDPENRKALDFQKRLFRVYLKGYFANLQTEKEREIEKEISEGLVVFLPPKPA